MVRLATILAALGALAIADAAVAATPASWARGANQICALQLQRIRAIPRPPAGDPIRAAAYIDKVDAVADPLTRHIAALPRPVSEGTLIRSWFAAGATVSAHNRRLADALRAGDSARASQQIQTLTAAGARADALARRLGARVCAQSP